MPTGAPDYFKRILLYGLYDGVATPLACDEQGRLILVTEAISSLYRSGTIIQSDDFSSGLTKVAASPEGTGAAVAIDTTEAYSRGLACKLTSGTDGARYALIQYFVHPSSFNKMGAEVKVRLDTVFESFEVEMIFYSGTRILKGKARYFLTGTDWEIYDYDSSAWVTVVENEVYQYQANEFIPLKLVLDLENETYQRFLVAFEEVDLTAYSISAADSSEPQGGIIKVKLTGAVAVGGYCIVDDVIITQDES